MPEPAHGLNVQLLTRRRNAGANDVIRRDVMQMKFPLLVAASALALSFAACSPENPASEASNATEVALDENTTVVAEVENKSVFQ